MVLRGNFLTGMQSGDLVAWVNPVIAHASGIGRRQAIGKGIMGVGGKILLSDSLSIGQEY